MKVSFSANRIFVALLSSDYDAIELIYVQVGGNIVLSASGYS